MHIHIGSVEFVETALYVIIFGFLWRSASAMLAKRDQGSTLQVIGEAMAFVF